MVLALLRLVFLTEARPQILFLLVDEKESGNADGDKKFSHTLGKESDSR